ncbi:L,D-transpeptidase [Sphingomonas sp. PB2P19]|uniref:L,D-transpeptidase n=1 Tax=Sphingomonas rhamnosi TaxID=3096156 RepID=UPI002FCA651D
MTLLACAPAAAWASPVEPPATATAVDAIGPTASDDIRAMAAWVVASADGKGLPFVIVDKVHAQVASFDAAGVLKGTAPALLGVASGDVSPPGIGTMRLSQITPAMRITPAGRFEATLGRDLGPDDVLWVDYDAAVSLHRVVTHKPAERRLQRLASATVLDNRISFGCINVPARFYDDVIRPLFRPANGIVYILPETPAFGSLQAKLGAHTAPS